MLLRCLALVPLVLGGIVSNASASPDIAITRVIPMAVSSSWRRAAARGGN